MTKTNLDAPLLKVLRQKRVDPPPVWFMRQAGRHLPEYHRLRSQSPDFIDFCLHRDLAVQATLQPVRRYDLDAAVVFSDILLIPWAMGRPLQYIPGRGPVMTPLPPNPDDPFFQQEFNEWSSRLDPVRDILASCRDALPAHVGLLGFAGAPWTLARYMLGGDQPLNALAQSHPDFIQRLLDALTPAVAAWLLAQADAGADAVQIFESHAADVPPTKRNVWLHSPLRDVIRLIKKTRPDLPVIAFGRGLGADAFHYALQARADAVSLDAPFSLPQAPYPIAVQGALDNRLLLSGGKPLDDAVRLNMRRFSSHPHIFNLSHGVLPDTPPQHVARVVALLRGAL